MLGSRDAAPGIPPPKPLRVANFNVLPSAWSTRQYHKELGNEARTPSQQAEASRKVAVISHPGTVVGSRQKGPQPGSDWGLWPLREGRCPHQDRRDRGIARRNPSKQVARQGDALTKAPQSHFPPFLYISPDFPRFSVKEFLQKRWAVFATTEVGCLQADLREAPPPVTYPLQGSLLVIVTIVADSSAKVFKTLSIHG